VGCASDSGEKIPAATYQGTEADYIIAPGDRLSVFVWNNPELSVEVPVRPDGKITTPLVEDVKASGKTSAQLAREIEGKLGEFVKYPKVSVTVTEFLGRYSEQIRVIGEAAEPKSLPYREGMTVLDVVIAVGGLTEFANGNKAILVRSVNGEQKRYRVRLNDLINDGDISANVPVLPGDVLTIPEVGWF
jgi:polysaccharide export outer membrane protein